MSENDLDLEFKRRITLQTIDLVAAVIRGGGLNRKYESIDQIFDDVKDVVERVASDSMTALDEVSSTVDGHVRQVPRRLHGGRRLTTEELTDPENYIATEIKTDDLPALPREECILEDKIACLECGKSYRNLQTHMTTIHRMSGSEYKFRWGLAEEFPMEHPGAFESRQERFEKGLGAPGFQQREKSMGPAVPIEGSVTPEYLLCLEDGKKLKMLKRHLRTTYDMSAEDYKIKWGLPDDYPMIAPNYKEKNSNSTGVQKRSPKNQT